MAASEKPALPSSVDPTAPESDHASLMTWDLATTSPRSLRGFHAPESWNEISFRWGEPNASLSLKLPSANYLVIVNTGSLRGENCDFDFELYWNQQQIAHAAVCIRSGHVMFFAPQQACMSDDGQLLTISCTPVANAVGASDHRSLGMPVRRIHVLGCGTGENPIAHMRPHPSARLGKVSSWLAKQINGLESAWRALTKKNKNQPTPRSAPSLQRIRAALTPAPPSSVNHTASGTPGQIVWRQRPLHEQETSFDVIVTPAEINDLHGTGPLIKRVLQRRERLLCIRSANHYGVHDFGDADVCLPHKGKSRLECYESVLRMMSGTRPRQVICFPYNPDDLKTSVVLQSTYNAPLCAWLMDDQNVRGDVIPDDLMAEFLDRCTIRFATHPELVAAYEQKYELRFELLPAVVPNQLVATQTTSVDSRLVDERRGALLGSIWNAAWFEDTCEVFSQLPWQLNWFGNHRHECTRSTQEKLAAAGIRTRGVVPERDLAKQLRRYPFAVVPASAWDGRDDNLGISELSLPGRILFAAATSHTPILLLGDSRCCAARFIKHFQLGEVVPYSAPQVADAIERLCRPEVQTRLRSNAASLAPQLSDQGIVEWFDMSIERGEPCDDRFERLFAGYLPLNGTGERTQRMLDGSHAA